MDLTEEQKIKRRLACKKHREKLGKDEYNRRQRKWFKENPKKRKEYDDRYRKRNRKKYNKRRRDQIRDKWNEVISILGDKCIVCGLKTRSRRRVSFHEIHGKPHKTNPWYILKHIKDFVPVCESCHKTIHKYHKYKEKIEQLEKFITNENENNSQTVK